MQGTSTAMVASVLFGMSVVVGCTTSTQIYLDEHQDFSHYRTWDWLPGEALTIEAPTLDAAGLDSSLARLVQRELALRGLAKVQGSPDLRVGAALKVRREVRTVMETGAVQQLSSLHASTSYHIQSTVARQEIHHRHRLVVFVSDTRTGRVVWQGTLEEESRGSNSPSLKRTVASLLQRFPQLDSNSESPQRGRGPADPAEPSEAEGSQHRLASVGDR